MSQQRDSSLAEPLVDGTSAPLTRSFVKKVSGIPDTRRYNVELLQQMQEEEIVKSTFYARARHTGIYVHELPVLFQRVMDAIPATERHCYHEGKIQYLLLEAARDKQAFPTPTSSSERLVRFVVDTVTSDPSSYKYTTKFDTTANSLMNGCSTQFMAYSDRLGEVVSRYKDYMDSAEQQEKRSWRRESPFRHKWTDADVKKFFDAHQKLGYGPRSNKKIAQHMGHGVHPNHVAYFKMQMRKHMKTTPSLSPSSVPKVLNQKSAAE